MPGQDMYKCHLCKKRHALRYCPKFVKMTVEERRAAVRQHNYCRNCLARSHTIEECESSGTCRKCGFQHHTMLHPRKFTVQQTKSNTSTRSIQSRLQKQQPARSIASTKPPKRSAKSHSTAIHKSSRHQQLTRRTKQQHTQQRTHQRKKPQKTKRKHQKPGKRQQQQLTKKQSSTPQPNVLILSEAIKSLATVLCATPSNFA